MIKIYCTNTDFIKKDKLYEFVDEEGKKYVINRDQTLALLRDPNYEVINLQIDKIGRIVYKSESSTVKSNQEEVELHSIFELCLNMFTENRMMTLIYENNKIKYLDDPIARISFLNDKNIFEILRKLEVYVEKKYKKPLPKLEINNPSKNWVYITYSPYYMECTYANIPNRYPILDSIDKFVIKTNVNNKEYSLIKKTMPVYNPVTKQVIENALVSVHVFNKYNEDAYCYAKEQSNENIYTCKFIKKYGVKRNSEKERKDEKVNERNNGRSRGNGGGSERNSENGISETRSRNSGNKQRNSENGISETIKNFRRLRRIFNWFNWFKR